MHKNDLLIECPSCNEQISIRAIKCPHCEMELRRECKACKSLLLTSFTQCPECGSPNVFEKQQQKTPFSNEPSNIPLKAMDILKRLTRFLIKKKDY